jgi:hypothetical protein
MDCATGGERDIEGGLSDRCVAERVGEGRGKGWGAEERDDIRHSSTGVVSTSTSTGVGVGCRRGAGHLLNV